MTSTALSSNSRGHVLALAIAIAVLVAVVLGSASSAFALSDISGTVSASTVGPLENVSVTLIQLLDSSHPELPDSWTEYDSTTTDSTGYFEFIWIPSGTYRLKYSDPTDTYRTQYWNGQTTFDAATNVEVPLDGSPLPDKDAVMKPVAEPDTTAPETSISSLPSDWVSVASIPFSLTASDTDSPSGIKTYYGLNAPADVEYAGSAQVTDEGLTTINFRSVDASGNKEATDSVVVKIDRTPPQTPITPDATYTAFAAINLTPTDALSGVESVRWTLDNVAGSATTVSTTALGHHTLLWSAIDKAGNRSATETVQFTVVAAATPVYGTRLRITGPSSIKVRRTYKLAGTISPTIASGSVKIVLKRLVHGKWRSAGSKTVSLSNGKYSWSFKPRYRGSWRATASYSGRSTSGAIFNPAPAVTKSFRVR